MVFIPLSVAAGAAFGSFVAHRVFRRFCARRDRQAAELFDAIGAQVAVEVAAVRRSAARPAR